MPDARSENSRAAALLIESIPRHKQFVPEDCSQGATDAELLAAHLVLFHHTLPSLERVTLEEVPRIEGPGLLSSIASESSNGATAALYRTRDTRGNPVYGLVGPGSDESSLRIAVISEMVISDGERPIPELRAQHRLFTLREWIKTASIVELGATLCCQCDLVESRLGQFLCGDSLQSIGSERWTSPSLRALDQQMTTIQRISDLASADEDMTLPEWYGDLCEIRRGLFERFESDLQQFARTHATDLTRILDDIADDLHRCFLGDDPVLIDRVFLRPLAYRLALKHFDGIALLNAALREADELEAQVIKLHLSLRMAEVLGRRAPS